MTGFLIKLLDLLAGLSWKTLYRISDVIGFLLFRVGGYRKATIYDNLRRSFPDKPEKELQKIASDFYRYFTDLVVETVKLSKCKVEEVGERVAISEESLACLNAASPGAVVVLGHRGNWELANLFASVYLKPEAITVYKPLADPAFEAWFRELRTRFGATVVPMKGVYGELGKARTRPYLLFLVNDQSPNPGTAYWTRFLNQDTGVFRGAENIARLYDVPVLFCDIRPREGKRGYYTLEAYALAENPKAERVNHILERQVRELEMRIREEPGNWLWSHKRWKHPKPAHLKPEQLLEA